MLIEKQKILYHVNFVTRLYSFSILHCALDFIYIHFRLDLDSLCCSLLPSSKFSKLPTTIKVYLILLQLLTD